MDLNAWVKLKYGRRIDPETEPGVLSAEDAAIYRPLLIERLARALRVPWQRSRCAARGNAGARGDDDRSTRWPSPPLFAEEVVGLQPPARAALEPPPAHAVQAHIAVARTARLIEKPDWSPPTRSRPRR